MEYILSFCSVLRCAIFELLSLASAASAPALMVAAGKVASEPEDAAPAMGQSNV